MDSIRVSEAPDPGSIPGEATGKSELQNVIRFYFMYDLFEIILAAFCCKLLYIYKRGSLFGFLLPSNVS